METAELRLIRKTSKTVDCWLWTGYCDSLGYGRININGKADRVHRVSYRLFKGEIPDGYVIDHLCSVRNCLNPEHLEAVTQRENIARSESSIATINAQKTHCPRGHAYTDENTKYTKKGRDCRICHRLSNKRRD